MDFTFPEAKKILKAALDQNWQEIKKYSSDYAMAPALISPLSEHNDLIIHFLAHSKRFEVFEKIVCQIDLVLGASFLTQANVDGNAVLHEAAISGNLEAVKLLVEKNGELVEMKNNDGETPLFRAAAFGKTKVVKFLASSHIDPGRKHVHSKREDGSSILSAAVQGKHFGTALEVLKLFEHITQHKDENVISLHLLAKMPSALNTQQQMGIWKKFLCFCLPIGCGHNDDADNIEFKDTKGGLLHKGLSVISDDNRKRCPILRRIWKDNRDSIFAYELARELIQKSLAWENSMMRLISILRNSERDPGGNAEEERGPGGYAAGKRRIPAFAATAKGNAEASEYLLELYPKALDPCNHRKPREIQEKGGKRQKIPLFATTRAKQEGSVKVSLDLYADALDQIKHTRKLDEKEEEILFAPTKIGNLEFIKFLLELYSLALEQINQRKSPEADKKQEEKYGGEEERETPLLAAIRTGNVEFVKLVIDEYPQVLTLCNRMKQNILHFAAMYRQKEIFDLVGKSEILTSWLARQIDVTGCTVLHYVADTQHDIGRTRSGPAYQLKAELEWFKRVEKIVPAYYTMLYDKTKRKTPFEIFKETHEKLHGEAKKWLKETSQSCSAVAVLVATVVFAAAFTVPGGTSDVNGQPILIHSPIFLIFTVMDVIALSCSLTAVVIFLSILTSPFELDDFYASLPTKLTLGFALLFMSVATTMLAFASTIFLVIRVEDRRAWTTTLICSASFFPVSVLALTHFPLFVSFINAWMNLFKFIWNALPCQSAIRYLKSSMIYQKVIRFLTKLISGLNQKSSPNPPPQEIPGLSGLIQEGSSNLPRRENPVPNV